MSSRLSSDEPVVSEAPATPAEHLVLIAATGGPVELDSTVLAAMRVPNTRVRIVANGDVRFEGDYASLAAKGIGIEGLAGEHPVERVVRVLTHPIRESDDTRA